MLLLHTSDLPGLTSQILAIKLTFQPPNQCLWILLEVSVCSITTTRAGFEARPSTVIWLPGCESRVLAIARRALLRLAVSELHFCHVRVACSPTCSNMGGINAPAVVVAFPVLGFSSLGKRGTALGSSQAAYCIGSYSIIMIISHAVISWTPAVAQQWRVPASHWRPSLCRHSDIDGCIKRRLIKAGHPQGELE